MEAVTRPPATIEEDEEDDDGTERIELFVTEIEERESTSCENRYNMNDTARVSMPL